MSEQNTGSPPELLKLITGLPSPPEQGVGFWGRKKLKKLDSLSSDMHDGWGRWGAAVSAWHQGQADEAWIRYSAAHSAGLQELLFWEHYGTVALIQQKWAAAEMAWRRVADQNATARHLRLYGIALAYCGHTRRALGTVTNACKLEKDYGLSLEILQALRSVLQGKEAALPASIPEHWLF